MYGSIVSEELYHAYSYTTSAISCLSNLLLIYVLSVTHIAHVGPYRYLLLTFAIVDILISLIHLAVIPAVHMTEFGYIFFSYRFIPESTIIGVWANLVWVFLFYQTFILLAFHFVYRYEMMCTPHWLGWIRRRPWRNWLIVGFVAHVTFVGGIFLACVLGLQPTDVSRREFAPILSEIYHIDLYAPNEPGFLALVYWTTDEFGERHYILWSLGTIAFGITVFFATGLIIVICTIRIIRELNESRVATLAAATKKLQKQLFTTLLVQTIIPCFTSYAPIGIIFIVPLTGIALEGIGTVLIMSTALFPMIDPYIVIFLIPGYRKAFRRLLMNNIEPSTPSVTHVTVY